MAVKEEIREALAGIVEGKIFYDEPMSRHTSTGVGGCADALVLINGENELAGVIRSLRQRSIEFLVAGNLTNVIVRDGGYRGVIVLMRNLNNVSYRCVPENGHYINAQAGASLASVVNRAAAAELAGMEFCAGIPGSVGGAVWMNAGAYGSEIKDVITAVSLLDAAGNKKNLATAEITFNYRRTVLPGQSIITGAEFKLAKGKAAEIKEKVADILRKRREKHPLDYPNAGSVFKNLPGMPAGRLIEEIGLKGARRGNAEISTKHANFICNTGGATAADVLELIELVQKTARRQKGVELTPELVIIGED
ncbi:MAG TPA: UDP-N-acetylmuramate dehydrogenase [Smithellaceae bacterium]|nr:UDP-N-acetylmuramate dehydrogenase [Smithellaceae bacterium]